MQAEPRHRHACALKARLTAGTGAHPAAARRDAPPQREAAQPRGRALERQRVVQRRLGQGGSVEVDVPCPQQRARTHAQRRPRRAHAHRLPCSPGAARCAHTLRRAAQRAAAQRPPRAHQGLVRQHRAAARHVLQRQQQAGLGLHHGCGAPAPAGRFSGALLLLPGACRARGWPGRAPLTLGFDSPGVAWRAWLACEGGLNAL